MGGGIFSVLSGLFFGILFGFAYYRARELEKDVQRGLDKAGLPDAEKERLVDLILNELQGASLLEKLLRKKRKPRDSGEKA